jgi:GNAT superfamily N-acetyltransferase
MSNLVVDGGKARFSDRALPDSGCGRCARDGEVRFPVDGYARLLGFDLTKKVIPQYAGEFVVRPVQQRDKVQVRTLALAAFQGMRTITTPTRAWIARNATRRTALWAERLVTTKKAADEVLVAEHDRSLVGFARLRLNSVKEAEGILYAVAPHYQRRGVCPVLMVHSLQWCRSQGVEQMLISTQNYECFHAKGLVPGRF